ncbi:MAG: hypothetical protein LBV55_03935 [Acholeplasmatales bacterium]|jgi:hypothetical protein|nr:hypothetical protein [Acholeplasmatales bacterium]
MGKKVRKTQKLLQFLNILLVFLQLGLSVLILIWNWKNGNLVKITNFISIGIMVIVLLSYLILFIFIKDRLKTLVFERRLRIFRITSSLLVAIISIYYAVVGFINLNDADKNRVTNIISIILAGILFLINFIKFIKGMKKAKVEKSKIIAQEKAQEKAEERKKIHEKS